MAPLADALGGLVAFDHVPDAASATDLINKEMRAGDAILVKGSNGIGLSRLVAALGDAARDGDKD
jgi:UDP-N-acetylmuramoyl-tripeptide--D-alanyl-D-alanine ligase